MSNKYKADSKIQSKVNPDATDVGEDQGVADKTSSQDADRHQKTRHPQKEK